MSNSGKTRTARDIALTRLRLHYQEWEGAHPTILLLHPNGMNSHVWDTTVRASALPNRFIAPDGRGHGRSEYPAEGYSLDEYLADNLELLDRLGLERVIVTGLATGGNIALLLASRYPERVLALVVANAGLSITPEMITNFEMKLRDHPIFPGIEEAQQAVSFSERWPATVLNSYAREAFRQLPGGEVEWRLSPPGVIETYRDMLNRTWDELHITCPTLLVRSGGSKVFTKEDVEQLCRAIPDARAAYMPEAGQLLNQDDPAGFARLLGTFVLGVVPMTTTT